MEARDRMSPCVATVAAGRAHRALCQRTGYPAPRRITFERAGRRAVAEGAEVAEETIFDGDPVIVEVAQRRVALNEGDSLTIGRDNDLAVIGLDSTDQGISRRHVRIDVVGGRCHIANLSTKRPIRLERAGEAGQKTVHPGGEDTAYVATRVLVPGRNNIHAIHVTPTQRASCEAGADAGDTTINYRELFSEDEISAMTALFEGYLLPHPRYDPTPRSYEAAAERLHPGEGKEKALQRRIEKLRERLAEEHILYAEGPRALSILADFVIGNAVLRPSDLERLATNR